jgi:predicted dehydrogenase
MTATQKAAFIGTGAIAREHLFALQFIDGVEAEAVCDLSPARAESAAERFMVPHWFTSHAEMLEKTKPDIVHITTPPQSHFELAKYCLEAGHNVLVEKPLTSSYQEFGVLRRVAESNGLKLMENQNYRCHSSVRRLHGMMQAGDFGKLIEVQIEVHLNIHAEGSVYRDNNLPHFTATMRGGVVGDFITHMTYIAQMFIGNQAKVKTMWKNQAGDAAALADEFRAVLQTDTALAYLSFSGNAQPAGIWLRVIGTQGQGEANLFEPPRLSVRLQRGGAAPLATLRDGLAEASAIAKTSVAGLYRKFSGAARYDGLEDYLRNCYQSLINPGLALATIEDFEATQFLVETMCSREHDL